MPAGAIESVFSDSVFTATELNRRVGAVLDRARRGPVTISRNNEQFALLRREQAASLFGTVSRIVRVVAVLSEANTAIAGGQTTEPYKWLQVYEKDDLHKLVAEVLQATLEAASGSGDWDSVEALIHEWHESALVAQSGVLDAAMYSQPSEDVPLEHPNEVLKASEHCESYPECQTKKS